MTTPLKDFAKRFEDGDDSALPFMVGTAIMTLWDRLEPADAYIIEGWIGAMLAGADPFRTEQRGRKSGGRNEDRGWKRPHADHDNLDIAWAAHRRIMNDEPKLKVYERVGKAYGLSADRVGKIYRANLPAMPRRVITKPKDLA